MGRKEKVAAATEPWQRVMIAVVGGVTLAAYVIYTLLHFNYYYTTNVLYNFIWISRIFLVSASFGELAFAVAPKSDERVLKVIYILAIHALFTEVVLGGIFVFYSLVFLAPLFNFHWIAIIIFTLYDTIALVPIILAVITLKQEDTASSEGKKTETPPTSKQTTSRKLVEILWMLDLFISLVYFFLYILFVSTYTNLQHLVISIQLAIIATNWILVVAITGDPYKSSAPNARGVIFLVLFLIYSLCGRLFIEGVNIYDLATSLFMTGYLLSIPNIIFIFNLIASTILAILTTIMIVALIVDYSQIKVHRD